MGSIRLRYLQLHKHMNLQNWYRKQGVVELVRRIAITCSAITLASCGNEPLKDTKIQSKIPALKLLGRVAQLAPFEFRSPWLTLL
jgi:hypothetical protein